MTTISTASIPEITVYSNHFVVEPKGSAAEQVLIDMAKGLISYNVNRNPFTGQTTETPDKVFCERTDNPRVYRFHIEMYESILKSISNRGLDYTVVTVPMYEPVQTTFPLSDTYTPRDYQEDLIEFINETGYKKIITMPTGSGKTLTFLFAMVREGVRTALVIPPKYMERWLTDTQDGFDDNEDTMIPLKPGRDIVVVQGTKELSSVILQAQAGELQPKFLIISAQTLFAFIKRFREDGPEEKMGNISPVDLWEVLGVGLVCVDEGHENFHANFRLELYTHVPKCVTLSATLNSDDPFLERMHKILYPLKYRRDGGAMSKHASILYVPYTVDEHKGMLKTSWKGRSDYSQLAYEADILRDHNVDRLANMFEMMIHDLEEFFIHRKADDYRMLIFFDSIEMVVTTTEYLADRYTDMKVGKYTAEESISVLDELDIIVATTKSADTGIDIKNLQFVQCFVARGSSKANIQMFGRIRKPKDPSVHPVFIFYHALNIPQHTKYTEKRRDIFENRATSQSTRHTHFTI